MLISIALVGWVAGWVVLSPRIASGEGGGGAGARRGGPLAVGWGSGRGWILKLGGRGKRSLAEREEGWKKEKKLGGSG
jgi:hypothetical protein